MRRTNAWSAALALLALWTAAGRATAAAAQSPRTTRENVNAWLTLNGEVELAPRWFVDYDASLRRHGPMERWQQVLSRAAVRYQLTPSLRLSWGYAFAETWPYGKLPAAFRFPEHRMWEQVQAGHTLGRVGLTHRYRLEQRWLGRVALEDGAERVQDWVRTNRIRYRVLATIPLQGATADDGEFYATAGDELFLNWGANVQSNVFDQNRVIASLGYRISGRLRLEAGYIEQLVAKANGRDLERNHTLTMAFFTAHSLGK